MIDFLFSWSVMTVVTTLVLCIIMTVLSTTFLLLIMSSKEGSYLKTEAVTKGFALCGVRIIYLMAAFYVVMYLFTWIFVGGL